MFTQTTLAVTHGVTQQIDSAVAVGEGSFTLNTAAEAKNAIQKKTHLFVCHK